jgi:2,3-bisphosphoglycerate-dependent phosphoglycerate mutase
VQLYIIRHAQSINNALYAAGQGDQVREHDPRLTELGLRQADCLAAALAHTNLDLQPDRADSQNHAGFGVTHLYCSLMLRAVQTGSAVAAGLGLPLTAWPDWHEEGGLFRDGDDGQRLPEAGPGRADFAREFPGLVLPADLDDAGWWNRPFEQPEERPVRARRVLAELLARHGPTDDRVAVVSHGGFFNHFMAALQDIQPPYRLNYLTNNTSLTRVALIKEGNYVVYQNRCAHLPPEMVTY